VSAERFFDDLARTLAEPMPRRRALRLAAGALVSAAVPGAFAQGTLAAPRSVLTTGQITCPKNTKRCACPSTIGGLEAVTCCPTHPYYEWTCTCPGYALCLRRETCPLERQHCGPCCPPGQVCNTLLEKCMCKRGAKCGPKCCQGSDCCVNTRLKSDDPRRWVCCKPPNRCEAGICKCPNGKPSCGGGECCRSPQTCDDCNVGASDFTRSFVGQKCCSPRDHCCGNTCCRISRFCCGAKCCPVGSACARAGGKDICCPERRAVGSGGRSEIVIVCCPPGTVAIRKGTGGCCPPGQPDCCPPTDGAGNVLDCGKDERICVSGRCVKP